MRRCSKCGAEKPLTEFSKSSNPFCWCKACCRDSAAAYRAANPDRVRAHDRARGAIRRADPEYRRWRRLYAMKTKYGLMPEQFDTLVIGQLGACALCGSQDDNLQIDHDHVTGVVRGLLCYPCNRALGRLGDLVPIMRVAAYLSSGRRLVDGVAAPLPTDGVLRRV